MQNVRATAHSELLPVKQGLVIGPAKPPMIQRDHHIGSRRVISADLGHGIRVGVGKSMEHRQVSIYHTRHEYVDQWKKFMYEHK